MRLRSRRRRSILHLRRGRNDRFLRRGRHWLALEARAIRSGSGRTDGAAEAGERGARRCRILQGSGCVGLLLLAQRRRRLFRRRGVSPRGARARSTARRLRAGTHERAIHRGQRERKANRSFPLVGFLFFFFSSSSLWSSSSVCGISVFPHSHSFLSRRRPPTAATATTTLARCSVAIPP